MLDQLGQLSPSITDAGLARSFLITHQESMIRAMDLLTKEGETLGRENAEHTRKMLEDLQRWLTQLAQPEEDEEKQYETRIRKPANAAANLQHAAKMIAPFDLNLSEQLYHAHHDLSRIMPHTGFSFGRSLAI